MHLKRVSCAFQVKTKCNPSKASKQQCEVIKSPTTKKGISHLDIIESRVLLTGCSEDFLRIMSNINVCAYVTLTLTLVSLTKVENHEEHTT